MSCKQKENEPKGQSKRLSAFPTLPAPSGGLPEPAGAGGGPGTAGLRSFLPSSVTLGIAELSASFSRRRGGREEARGKDSKVTSAVLVSHFLLCKVGRAGSMFLLVLKNIPAKMSVRRI